MLHFWEYRDDPLEEAIWQVGYLDFLSNQLRDEPVTVLGVAVNNGIDAPDTRPAVLRSIRPEAIHEPRLSHRPRQWRHSGVIRRSQSAGAELPLWVVIDADGRVSHYHAGYYEIDVNRGLEQLDAVVRELLPAAAP